jgi:hypothetical protein
MVFYFNKMSLFRPEISLRTILPAKKMNLPVEVLDIFAYL